MNKKTAGPEAKDRESRVLVWTMAKVATTSLTTTLRRADIPFNACHYLNPAYLRYELHWAGGRIEKLDESTMESFVNQYYLPMLGENCRLKITTSMRDPVARNISAYFQKLSDFESIPLDLPERLDQFLSAYPHSIPLEWFDFELRDVLGFDIFAHAFDKKRGWSLFSTEIADIFVMRTDASIEHQSEGLATLLSLDRIEVVPEYRMKDREKKADPYAAFLEWLVLPKAYLDFFYDSDVVRYFWSPEQIAAMRARWRTDDRPWAPSRWFLSQIREQFPQPLMLGQLIGENARPKAL